MPAPRSPRYPNISLTEAIGRAKAVYQAEHLSTMTPTVAAEAMGYKGISGASLKTISSLKKYGLLEGRGEDVRLTKDAQTLAIVDSTSTDFVEALKRAANAPEIFQEITKQFQGNASERNIAVYLERQGFRSDAASTVAKYYKDSQALVSGISTTYAGVEDHEDAPPPMKITADTPRPPLPVRFPSVAPPSFWGGEDHSAPVGDEGAPFRITMNGKKLHIVADVDLESLQTLKQVLESYETVLKLLQQPAGPVPKTEPPVVQLYRPGDFVTVDGFYTVHHQGHGGEGRSEYHKGQRFTACDGCSDRLAVRYAYAEPLT